MPYINLAHAGRVHYAERGERRPGRTSALLIHGAGASSAIWLMTLARVARAGHAIAIDLPGHGAPFGDKSRITAFQGYLRDLVDQGRGLKAQGKTAEETAQLVDLTKYHDAFPQIQNKGADLRGVRRLFVWLDEQAKR